MKLKTKVQVWGMACYFLGVVVAATPNGWQGLAIAAILGGTVGFFMPRIPNA